MKSNLEIKTSFVSPKGMNLFILDGYLPIFILRNISTSNIIGKYSNTVIHLKELSPSSELFHKKRDGLIDFSEFKENYLSEISKVDFKKIIKKLENLVSLTEAKGVVLLGYGSNYEICHRSIISDLLNKSNLLNNKVVEYSFDKIYN